MRSLTVSRALVLALIAAPATAASPDVLAPDKPSLPHATLGTREMILVNQVGFARGTARWRARELYRLLNNATDGDGAALPPGDRARAISAGLAALARDLHEQRVLTAELAHVRADRSLLEQPAPADAQASQPSGKPPQGYLPPVTGPVEAWFGPARDGAGIWLFRAGLRLRARPGETVRAPAAGTVRRVIEGRRGATIVLGHADGVTTILSGLGQVRAAPGHELQRGDSVGIAVARAAASLDVEVWLGRAPIDPASVFGLKPAATARR